MRNIILTLTLLAFSISSFGKTVPNKIVIDLKEAKELGFQFSKIQTGKNKHISVVLPIKIKGFDLSHSLASINNNSEIVRFDVVINKSEGKKFIRFKCHEGQCEKITLQFAYRGKKTDSWHYPVTKYTISLNGLKLPNNLDKLMAPNK